MFCLDPPKLTKWRILLQLAASVGLLLLLLLLLLLHVVCLFACLLACLFAAAAGTATAAAAATAAANASLFQRDSPPLHRLCDTMLIHVGTCAFGGKPTRDVLLLSLDDATGTLELVSQQTLSFENPGWILHVTGGAAYVAFENEEGCVQGFTVDGSGGLAAAGAAVATHGAHPCYLAAMGGVLLCSNYSEGPASLVVLPRAGVRSRKQAKPFPVTTSSGCARAGARAAAPQVPRRCAHAARKPNLKPLLK